MFQHHFLYLQKQMLVTRGSFKCRYEVVIIKVFVVSIDNEFAVLCL